MKEKYECPSCKRINNMNEEMDKAMKKFNMLIKKEALEARNK
tara:strand:+ start:69 stop:194 length:126 start_codon:yes stop_codon:yes gene_type:complete